MKADGAFKNYIEYIQFPFYKNLVKNTRVEFQFPLTVLVGRNGSGKSSTLHALYGSVNGKTCSDFWFSTELDPIKESENRNRYFYGYKEDRQSPIKEVLKQRMKRGSTTKVDDPDYWETAKPQQGMKSKIRNSPVSKNVVYIDFRAELSAFDKEYHFAKMPIKDRKKRLRERAKYLKRLFAGQNMKFPGVPSEKMASLTILDRVHIEKINYILGKKYSDIRMAIDHKLYRDLIGTSVFLKTEWENSYSEANAGSGEIAVTQLVRKVLEAKEYSLILLDEPEVSLHPSAQRRLKSFLIEQIKLKKVQIIISTHSPILIENMPESAIKLYRTNENGSFEVIENISYQEAFLDIGEVISDKIIVYCEDCAAKYLIEKTLVDMGKMPYFKVVFRPGGAGTLLSKYLPVFSGMDKFKDKVFFILDGDMKKERNFIEGDLTKSQQDDAGYLKAYIKDVLGIEKIEGFLDGHKGRYDVTQQCKVLLDCLRFSENVEYLPVGGIPESIILNSNYVKESFAEILNGYSEINPTNAKEVVQFIAENLTGDKNKIASTIEILSHKWANEASKEKNDLVEVLERIFSKYNKGLRI